MVSSMSPNAASKALRLTFNMRLTNRHTASSVTHILRSVIRSSMVRAQQYGLTGRPISPGHQCPEERHLSPDRGAHFAPILHSDGTALPANSVRSTASSGRS